MHIVAAILSGRIQGALTVVLTPHRTESDLRIELSFFGCDVMTFGRHQIFQRFEGKKFSPLHHLLDRQRCGTLQSHARQRFDAALDVGHFDLYLVFGRFETVERRLQLIQRHARCPTALDFDLHILHHLLNGAYSTLDRLVQRLHVAPRRDGSHQSRFVAQQIELTFLRRTLGHRVGFVAQGKKRFDKDRHRNLAAQSLDCRRKRKGPFALAKHNRRRLQRRHRPKVGRGTVVLIGSKKRRFGIESILHLLSRQFGISRLHLVDLRDRLLFQTIQQLRNRRRLQTHTQQQTYAYPPFHHPLPRIVSGRFTALSTFWAKIRAKSRISGSGRTV